MGNLPQTESSFCRSTFILINVVLTNQYITNRLSSSTRNEGACEMSAHKSSIREIINATRSLVSTIETLEFDLHQARKQRDMYQFLANYMYTKSLEHNIPLIRDVPMFDEEALAAYVDELRAHIDEEADRNMDDDQRSEYEHDDDDRQ